MPVKNGNRKLKNKKQIKPKAQLYAWIPHFFLLKKPTLNTINIYR